MRTLNENKKSFFILVNNRKVNMFKESKRELKESGIRK